MSTIIEQPRYSCALAAQQTVLAIKRAFPILHAGPGCSSKAYMFAAYGSGFQGEGLGGGAHISCTNASEQEVVFGGESKLRKTIDGALKVLDGDLFVVLTGCTSDIVGDDSISIANEFAKEGYPVVGAETAGFKGNNYYGHEVVVNAIIEQFVGDIKPRVRKGLINVFSVVPFQNPYWRGDLETIKDLLEEIGLKVNILFGNESKGVTEWKDIPNAEFNLLLSPWVGLKTVELLKQKYNTPFLQYPVLPVGAKETSKFLREVAQFAGIDNETVEAVIKKEEERYYSYFVSMADFVAEYRNNLPLELYTVADSSYAIGISSFLVNEVGFLPKGVYITDDPRKSKEEFITKTLLSKGDEFKDTIVIEADGGKIEADIRNKIGNTKRAIILGSSWDKSIALQTKNLYSFISLPLYENLILNNSYLGYSGGLRLVEEIYSSVFRRGPVASRNQLTD